MPITVVATEELAPAYVELVLSPRTLPPQLWRFFRTHVRPDLSDVAVAGPGGPYPTRAVRRGDGSIAVYFRVDRLGPGVHRLYLYFGDPHAESPPYPLEEGVEPGRLVGTPSRLPHTIRSSMAWPAHLLPEANWLPEGVGLRYGLVHTRSRGEFLELVETVRRGGGAEVRRLIERALSGRADFPVGTSGAQTWFGYAELRPRTDLGYAPWGAAVVVPLPSLARVPRGLEVLAELWVASDDGSAAYIVALEGDTLVYRARVYDSLCREHPPRYWNYLPRWVRDAPLGGSPFLVLLVQNGICGGSGPGYLDFRLVMWYVERVAEDQRGGPYLEVEVRGVGEELRGYALPVELTGRSDVDWSLFTPESVYVVSESGAPLYYWVQTVGERVVVWVRIPHLPAGGVYRFRIHYGGPNPYREYGDPERVFAFFDDFERHPRESGKWSVYANSDDTLELEDGRLYLIRWRRFRSVAMFMRGVDWRRGFHAQLRVYVRGAADGMTFFFFKDEGPYARHAERGAPTPGGSLALDVWTWWGVVRSAGYAVEIDIYDNGGRDPSAPHVALVETFSEPGVHDNVHRARARYPHMCRGRWCVVDVYYHGGRLIVRVGGVTLIDYRGGVFEVYGARYGGMGISAATGAATGVFGVDYVLLRYWPGEEPKVTIVGRAP